MAEILEDLEEYLETILRKPAGGWGAKSIINSRKSKQRVVRERGHGHMHLLVLVVNNIYIVTT